MIMKAILQVSRVLLYTLRFTAKTYLFGPVSSATNDIIKRSTVSYYSGDSKSTTRDITYKATPRAIKDYTGDVVTNLAEDIDDAVTVFNVDSGSSVTLKKYIEIGGEEMFVTKKSGNKITVEEEKMARLLPLISEVQKLKVLIIHQQKIVIS